MKKPMNNLPPKTEPTVVNQELTNLPTKFTAVTVLKESYLAAIAYEVTIENGTVTSSKPVSTAPDLMQVIAGHCTRRLWELVKVQKSPNYRED
jgi:hypothetical protein